ncbi:MAG: response regulator [Verrucomicrobia bacterium]|jgi:signal transduction histidine kinase/DNA-binding NarL/FixJ family response regulator|nr:response regulator [Verrucomicrobiota bacterium]
MFVVQNIFLAISFFVLVAACIWSWRDRKRNRAAFAEITDERDHLRTALTKGEEAREAAYGESAWFKKLFDSARDMVLVYGITDEDKPTQFLAANDATCEILEYSRDQLLSMTPLEIETVHEPEVQRSHTDVELLTLSNTEMLARDSVFASRNIQNLIKRVQTGEAVVYNSSLVTQSGRRIPAEITAHRFSETERMVVCTIRDLSEREKAAMELRASEQRFKDFFASSPIGAATYTAQRTLINVNLSCLRIFGAPDSGEFGKLDIFDSPFLPASAKEGINRGQTVHCEVVFDFDKLLDSRALVSSRRGKAFFDILFNNLGRDHEHNPLGYLIQVQDITERREAEAALQLREAQLRQAQKMEAIGTMAGGIAHDFNNILTPILGYSDIGMELTPPGERMHDFMREIRSATMRAKELVHQILVFSRQSEEAQTLIHLSPIVKEVAKQQVAGLPSDITVTHVVRVKEDLVFANPTQVHQVLTNFCTNAAYAMKGQTGSLDIRLTQFNMGWRHRQEFPELKKGSYLRISVKDTGCGVPDDIRERIFDPFFSTKPSGEGTGMGLSVVHGIVCALGGGIALDTELGEGSTFHVALPLADALPVEEATVWEAPPSGNERILFVDDEQGIAKMATHMLTSLGYEPVVTSNSLKALEIFEENPNGFDILVTDQVMPDLTGSELAMRLREIRPELPVVICSGFSGKLTEEKAEQLGINEFLIKPISRRELGEAIRRALGKAPSPPSETATPEAATPEPAPTDPADVQAEDPESPPEVNLSEK